ncbi:MAG: BamA/TamA family outer membrane protein [Bacteroidaceae bacterium]|nr:BamA/TamA family outer membrane protein [Bacteroidaceae bacterium]
MPSKSDLQLVRSLATAKGRREHRLFVAEGHRLVEELLGHFQCCRLWANSLWIDRHRDKLRGAGIEAVTDAELERLSLQQHPQDVLALFHIPSYDTDGAVKAIGSTLTLALDGLQDPGNLGTIIRVADWFGIHDIWCSQGTVDAYNPKVVQASMGGLARVRLHYVSLPQLLSSLPADIPVYGTSLQGKSLWETELTPDKGIIVMGNEGNGVSAEVAALCNRQLFIPPYPTGTVTTESLNVGVATSIVLAEFRRRASKLIATISCLIATAFILAACSSAKFLDEDELLLNSISLECDDPDINTTQFSGYIRQQPNARWFSLFKVPLGMYCIGGTDTTRAVTRFFHRVGEAPVVHEQQQTERSRTDIEAAVRNLGYLNAEVSVQKQRHKHRLDLTYDIHTGQRFHVDSLAFHIDDPAQDSLLQGELASGALHVGMPFDINVLDRERSRLTAALQNQGYYHFNKSMITFQADTARAHHKVALAMNIPLYRPSTRDSLRRHQRFHIGTVEFRTDTTVSSHTSSLRESFLRSKTELETGELYHENDAQTTYNNLSSLSAVLGTNIAFTPVDDTLNTVVNIVMARRHSLSTEIEGTNSAGDFGAAVSLGYQNRNLFRRSASLDITLRGAYEAIHGLEGYTEENYIEYSAEAELNFPEFIMPILRRPFRHRLRAQSIAAIMYDSQDRPEFHRRVLTAGWRYRLTSRSSRVQHRIDMIDLDYVFMPWISETFRKEYLDDVSSRNAILRFNYENLFIMRWGYNFRLTNLAPTSQYTYGRNAYSFRAGVETAGNLLRGLSSTLKAQYSEQLNSYTLFNIAYAQYIKFDVDFSKSFVIDSRNSAAMHFAMGIAVPYGNSQVLPYEKRYFSGGANSVRGWAVRGLGPGSFSGTDGRIDFIHQTGDMKLDASAEWRTHLAWKLDGAVFVDAGNVWTVRNYVEQPGGQFRFDKFWKQIAVAYGLGLRLNAGYFIIRLDAGMKAINPAYETGRLHYPIVYPNLKRDFHLHFAVGLPY